MPLTSAVTYLHQLIAPDGTVMEFEPWWGDVGGIKSDFERPGATYVVPGSDTPIDPFGAGGNPVAPRTYEVTFLHCYEALPDGTREQFQLVHDRFRRMVAHGQTMRAVERCPDGSLRYGWLKLVRLPGDRQRDDKVRAILAATFAMVEPYWSGLLPANARVFGTPGLVFGVGGLKFGPVATPLAAASQTITIDNRAATYPDYAARISVAGAYGGARGLRLTNLSATRPYRGRAVPLAVGISRPLAAGEQLVIECGVESVRINGIPAYGLLTLGPDDAPGQLEFMRIEPGVENVLLVEALGASPATGGSLSIRSLRKYV
jgi:hypothetical protein